MQSFSRRWRQYFSGDKLALLWSYRESLAAGVGPWRLIFTWNVVISIA